MAKVTVADLIKDLQKLPPELEATILDGFNGGGSPRTINLGPHVWDPKDSPGLERNDYSDIKTPSGEPIVVMGYGCY